MANEIEASSQYRHRVALENDEGRTEEDKYSAVVRDRDRDGGERERGRDSPGFSSAGSRFDTVSSSFPTLLTYVVFLHSILMIIAVFILGRASTFLYPREQENEKWEFLEGAKELYPLCLIEQIDLAPQAPPLDPSPLVVVPFLPLIGAALCLSEEDSLHTNHRAAHLLSPAPQSQVTLALLPHTHSHIRSHTHSLSQTLLGLSMEVSFVYLSL